MTKEREQEIKRRKTLERKEKYRKSVTKIIGMVLAVIFVIAAIIIIQIIRK
jgi:hypothetical protein